MIDFDKLEPVLLAKIAENILASLTPEQRDQILVKAVAGSLESWDFKHHVVDKAVAVRGADMLVEFLRRPHPEERLRTAIERGFEMYIESLPVKIFAGLCEMMHGKRDPNGTYHQYGSILRLMEVKG